jgi:hypothetical protein
VGLLFLAREAHWEPRGIALGCVLNDYLRDGAKVESVGWGVTDPAGTVPTLVLNELRLRVTDPDCTDDYFCREPGGELMAGGEGEGPCFGDSGGPLYLLTDEGDWLVGVASRVLSNGNVPCGNGAIWVRPDAVVKWIENQVDGLPLIYPSCNEAPTVSVDPIATKRNRAAVTTVAIDDPDGSPDAATLAVAQAPEHGTVEVLRDHQVEYTPERGYVGPDSFTLTVADEGTGNERTGAPIAVDLDVDVTVDGCGCAASGSSPAWIALLLPLVGRRRR